MEENNSDILRWHIGVTGHRTIQANKKELKESISNALNTIKSSIVSTSENKEIEIILNSGMALGFDQLVCEVCLENNIPYNAIIPHDNQDALWNENQKKHYAFLCSKANKVQNVNPGPYSIKKLHLRNSWIVKNSDEFLVYWDGLFSSGTGSTIKKINQAKKRFVNLY